MMVLPVDPTSIVLVVIILQCNVMYTRPLHATHDQEKGSLKRDVSQRLSISYSLGEAYLHVNLGWARP